MCPNSQCIYEQGGIHMRYGVTVSRSSSLLSYLDVPVCMLKKSTLFLSACLPFAAESRVSSPALEALSQHYHGSPTLLWKP